MKNLNNKTIKFILAAGLIIFISITTYIKLYNKNITPEENKTNTDKNISEQKYDFAVTDKIVGLSVTIPVSNDEKTIINITEKEAFNEISNIIKNLKMKDEKLPEGIGFENPYIIAVQFEKQIVEFILTSDNDLCILSNGNIYETTKDNLNKYLNSLK